jgi:lipopolysaccharide export system protein LptA
VSRFAAAADAELGRRLAATLAESLGREASLEGVTIQDDAEPVQANPDAGVVRQWAEANGLEVVVVGAILGGEPAALAVEVRDGHSGAALRALRASAAESGTWSGAVAELTGAIRNIVLGSEDRKPATTVASGNAPPLLSDLRSDAPMEISSDELEVLTRDGERHIIFKRNVRVQQGDVVLRTQELNAFYPREASQPERLVATGRVRVEQGERRAECDRATYRRSDQTIVCSGHAMLRQGCDLVRGQEIHFDLEREHFRVVGAASVVLQNGDPNAESCEGKAS